MREVTYVRMRVDEVTFGQLNVGETFVFSYAASEEQVYIKTDANLNTVSLKTGKAYRTEHLKAVRRVECDLTVYHSSR